MPEPTEDLCPKCLLFSVLLESDFSAKLRSINAAIAQLLADSLSEFLLQWLQTVHVTVSEQGYIEIVVGISWFYLEPTSALRDMIANSISAFVENFALAYCAAKGEQLTDSDLDNISVTCITGLP
ncbi:E4 ORFC [bat adenovirus 3]|uniref:E4 ORFC n=1 Tax=bat adenovirus 3 TaxID=2758098 RepID=D3X7D5_9ADEN|nr:E4 ORFC [bat adenovirus 3]ADD17124.1 E4 ORFC [bat adenovirus 3]